MQGLLLPVGEADGRRGACEIASCLYKWLTTIDTLKLAKTVILYCDCCSGQNRNRVVVAMLRYALINCDFIETIHLKFLLPGHTYMPADSIHATVLLHFVRKRVVRALSEWTIILRSTRTDPELYIVVTVSIDNFLQRAQIQRAILPTSWRSETDHQRIRWKVRTVAMTKTSAKFEIQYSLIEDAESHKFCL